MIDTTVRQFEVHGHRIEKLLADLLAELSGPLPAGCEHQAGDTAAEGVLKKLNVKHHADHDSEGYLHWTLADSVGCFWAFQGRSMRQQLRGGPQFM